MIEFKDVSYTYSADSPFETAALKNVSLTIEKGRFYGLIGHTGSGKTTLVQLMAGLLSPNEGEIYIDGANICDKKVRVRDITKKIGLVFQYPEYQLFEETVFDDVAFGPKNLGCDEAEVKRRVERALSMVGIEKPLHDKSPFELSGGEKRRVAIAGTLSMEPSILILDEPTAGLDPKGKNDILAEVSKLHREQGVTVIMISHSMEDIAKSADSIIVMQQGSVALSGGLSEVFSQSERLLEMGLALPQISRVVLELREKGINLDKNIFTVSEAAEHIIKMAKGKGKDEC